MGYHTNVCRQALLLLGTDTLILYVLQIDIGSLAYAVALLTNI